MPLQAPSLVGVAKAMPYREASFHRLNFYAFANECIAEEVMKLSNVRVSASWDSSQAKDTWIVPRGGAQGHSYPSHSSVKSLLETSGGRGRGSPSGIFGKPRSIGAARPLGSGFDAWSHILPAALIFRLLLAPNYLSTIVEI